jgi:hypothetical protein
MKSGKSHLLRRGSISTATVLTTYIALQNFHNVLWSGHEPLFN